MKIKLEIRNYLEDCMFEEIMNPDETTSKRRVLEPYDEEKWKNGRIYEFNTLKEVREFTDSCDIDFTDEYSASFCQWSWEEIDLETYISKDEDNLLIFEINSHEEWRD